MNKVQNIFEFNIITLFPDDEFSIPIKDHPINIDYFDEEISKTSCYKKNKNKFKNIDNWIGITSEAVGSKDKYTNLFFNTNDKINSLSGKNVGIITSRKWDKKFSPPSLFEYIIMSVFTCSLYLLSYDFNINLKPHKTRGCILDFTYYKPERKILVSSPWLCSDCKKKLCFIETQIRKEFTDSPALCQQIDDVLSRRWMGNPEQRETPFYNLRKMYKYNIDRNSGFNKDWKEKFRESISNKLAEWTLGSILSGIIGGIIVAIFFIFFGIRL